MYGEISEIQLQTSKFETLINIPGETLNRLENNHVCSRGQRPGPKAKLVSCLHEVIISYTYKQRAGRVCTKT